MRFVGLDELTGAEVETWRRLRDGNPLLDSAYFDPAFAAAVHASGADVVVALDGRGPDLTTLLPCHRSGSVLRPVGWPGADFQAPVRGPGSTFDPRALLVDGVRSFHFDHWVSPGPEMDPWVESRAVSPYVEVDGGLEGYLSRASASGRDNIAQARRRTGRAEREVGPVRFDARSQDPRALAWLIEHKRRQYAATGARDYFAVEGRRRMLSTLMHTHERGCTGMLSTLHFGDALVAAHFGIRSARTLHWWFPTYDPAFARFAPGWILLRELAMAAPGLGLERIDLGRGDDEYKRRAKTGEVEVSAGVVTSGTAVRAVRGAGRAGIAAAKASPLAPLLRRSVHAARRRRAG